MAEWRIRVCAIGRVNRKVFTMRESIYNEREYVQVCERERERGRDGDFKNA